MSNDLEKNKALVLEAMTALFQRRDAFAVERLYSPSYVQHNPSIPQGRDALAKLVSELPSNLFYEPGLMIAEGSYVAIHGRIRGWAPTPQIVVDLPHRKRTPRGALGCHSGRGIPGLDEVWYRHVLARRTRRAGRSSLIVGIRREE